MKNSEFSTVFNESWKKTTVMVSLEFYNQGSIEYLTFIKGFNGSISVLSRAYCYGTTLALTYLKAEEIF